MTLLSRLVVFPLALAVAVSGCGEGRSVEAFCDSYTEFIELPTSEAAFASEDPSATRDYFEAVVEASEVVARVAPEEIQADTETMAQSVSGLLDALKEVDYDLTSVDPTSIDVDTSSAADESIQAFYLANCEGTASS